MARRRRLRISSPDVGALAPVVRRTHRLGIGLTAAVVALLVAAAVSAHDLDTRDPGLLPRGTSGVVVIDLSLSIADEDYADVRRILRGIAGSDARIGLVVFSDVPYELFPPGTPASELRPVLRLLSPQEEEAPHPWTQGFRAGTRISSALELAAAMLERDRVARPSILLVSDLATAPEDVPVLARTVEGLRSRGIPLRVAAIDPSSDGRALFAGLLEEGALTISEGEGKEPRASAVGRLPASLLLLATALFAALGLHERLTARLGLPYEAQEEP